MTPIPSHQELTNLILSVNTFMSQFYSSIIQLHSNISVHNESKELLAAILQSGLNSSANDADKEVENLFTQMLTSVANRLSTYFVLKNVENVLFLSFTRNLLLNN